MNLPLDPIELEERLAAIEVALRGDLKGNSGALQNLIRLMNDVYHATEGLQHRLSVLETWKTSREERLIGATWVIKSMWAAGGLVIGWLLKHFKIV